MVIALFMRTDASGTIAIRSARRRAWGMSWSVRNHFVDQPDAQRLLRVDMVACKRVAVGRLPSAQRRKQEGRI